MFRISRSQHHRRIEAQLRNERPAPPDELIRALSRRVGTRPTGVPRLAFAGALTVVMLVALASVGGISYAGNTVKSAIGVAKSVVSPSSGKSSITVLGINSGGDQYRPGYGWGDPNHNHSGPPGLKLRRSKSGELIRFSRSPDRKAWLVSLTVVVDEQAVLRLSVLKPNRQRIVLSQAKGAKVGAGLRGPPTKTILYRVLVPRAIPVTLRIPVKVIVPGRDYTIRISATDPDKNVSVLNVKFTPPFVLNVKVT